MDLLIPKEGLMFWTTLTFLLLYLILYRFAWGPMRETLDERERKIRESLEKADMVQAKADEAMKKQEVMFMEARQQSQEMVVKAKATAQSMRDEIIKKARDEADSLLERAKSGIMLERQKAIEEIRELAVDLSLAATQKAIGKALSGRDHQNLVADSLKEMGELN